MAIPTGYTLETFGLWLTNEVFFEDAGGLGLAPLGGTSVPSTFKDLTLEGNETFVPTLNSYYTLNILPSPFEFDRNETITLDNGIVLTVDPGGYHESGGDADLYNAVNYGDVTIYVQVTEIPVGTDIHDGLKSGFQTSVGYSVALQDNPVIESIMNKTLARMELQDISEVVPSNLYTFRRIAVVETLQTVMQSKASDYSVLVTESGAVVQGGTVFLQIKNLFASEDADLGNYIQNLDDSEQTTNFNILTEGLSSNGNMGVVW